eukprot:30808-Eustigmatos_ZCMA.PRE.1
MRYDTASQLHTLPCTRELSKINAVGGHLARRKERSADFGMYPFVPWTHNGEAETFLLGTGCAT